MRISLVAAVSKNGVIGLRGKLPWRLPAELRHFRVLTTGHPVLMGRRTWESIGRALPGRLNVVLSRDETFRPEGALAARSFEEALELARPHAEAMVIGGAALFETAVIQADRVYLTLVDHVVEAQDGAARFPTLSPDWEELPGSRVHHLADADNAFAFDTVTLERTPRLPP